MSVSIRAVVEDDIAAISDIDARASAFAWTPEQFQKCTEIDNSQERGLVIVCAAQVAGFVIFNHVLDEGSIYNIAVDPDHQRRGLASKLLFEAIERMKLESVKRCFLDVRRSNAAALALYSDLGFEIDGVRKNYYRGSAGREDAMLMSKLL
ncbi:MAG: ribosomal-protein-alanine N-acetyltransferase [Halioglobus sp.]|jgi:ribosomal-protein-alanine N-acetyltransferase